MQIAIFWALTPYILDIRTYLLPPSAAKVSTGPTQAYIQGVSGLLTLSANYCPMVSI